MMSVECVLQIRAGGGPKGESPVWSAAEQCLYWVDIDGCALHRFDPATGRDTVRNVGERIGCVALTSRGGFVLGLASGVYLLDTFDTGAPRLLVAPEPDRAGNRLNDGRSDPFGRFWIGSMLDPPDNDRRTGALYCIDGARCTTAVGGLHVGNGLAFTADRRRMYHSDSWRAVHTIWTADVDPVDGRIANRRVLAVTADGRPDGGCCDADGCYWSCHIDGSRVVRFTPDGRIDRTIPVPVRWPTMCAFGGPALDILYITSLRRGGAAAEHHDQPLAGSLFACRPGVTGIPEPLFEEAGTGLPDPV
jgi:sugar lactone lactonase YvrE